MSLSKFARYIDEKYQWSSISLRSKKIVIKGDALCYYLYYNNYSWQNGGHYHEFCRTVRDFLDRLNEQDTEAYVVMNGADTNEEKYKQRCLQRLYRIADIQATSHSSVHSSVLPLFARTVFVEALRDYGIPFVVADGDSDPDCVALANHLECPVLADDADFFIFNIDKGYVPLYDSARSLINFSTAVRCYNFKAFDAQFNLSSRDQRLYIPFIFGRDPLPKNTSNYVAFQYIDRQLNTIRHSPEYYGYERSEVSYGIGEEMSNIRSFYRVQPTSFETLLYSTNLDWLNPRIPPWVFQAYKRSEFNHLMMHVLISGGIWRYTCIMEDTRKSSACAVADKPRRFMLGALSNLLQDPSNIRVTQRSAIPFDLIVSNAHLKEKHLQILSEPLENISLQIIKTRQRIFVRSFNCKHIQLSIEKIPVEFRMVVIASRAWLKTNRAMFGPLLIPLVFCILSCSGRYPKPQGILSNPNYDLSLLHSFAQWQCLLYHAIALNQLLGCPFQYTSPAQLFSCSVVEYFRSNPPLRPFEELPSLMISVIRKL